MPHTLLFVDDEEHILSALLRVFRREGYAILTAPSGPEALRVLQETSVALVMSDQRMPEMTGVELLRQVRALAPDTMRLLLTGYVDLKAAMAAINEGEVYRFIGKPWDDNDLRAAVREALARYELVVENRRLQALTAQQNEELRGLNATLEARVAERTQELVARGEELERLYADIRRHFTETIRVFVGLMELHHPALGGHCRRVAELAAELARRCGIEGEAAEAVEVGALLHDIGLIGVPAALVRRPEEDLDQAQAALVRQHPALGETALGSIPALQAARALIRSHHEAWNGKGYPDGLRGEEIPRGARIIAICDLYDDLVRAQSLPGPEALRRLKLEGGRRLDPDLLHEMSAVVARHRPAEPGAALTLAELQEGMILARDLRTGSGRLLLPQGAVLHPSYIAKLKNFHRIDPIVDRIFVRRREDGDPAEAREA